ncbi:HK97 gp10 family phage protein [Ochrobactrum sp. Kaboul]|nr:HK97 gp10 family phage protein [Ochrobactrum sp. Kaboul]
MVVRARLKRTDLMKKIQQIAPKAIEKMAEAQMQVAEEVAEAIKARAPVRANGGGEYRDSIHAAKQSDNPDKKVFGARKSTDPNAVGIYGAYIWRFLEYGTKASAGTAARVDRRYKSGTVMTQAKGAHAATPAQPHIFPVWRGMRKKAVRRIRAAMNKAIREAMKK